MYKIWFVLLVWVVGCQKPSDKIPNMRSVIDSTMEAQQMAWNRGDLTGFMDGYRDDDSLCFIGKRGLTYGWKATLDNYLKGYPDAKAMGTLKFTPLRFDSLAGDAAFVVGKWQLFREKDTLSGHYSLLWRQISGKWVIVADHSS
jgi:ketosteroid isomerase-like protein